MVSIPVMPHSQSGRTASWRCVIDGYGQSGSDNYDAIADTERFRVNGIEGGDGGPLPTIITNWPRLVASMTHRKRS